MRLLAALLTTGAGIALLASLWFRELNPAAVLDALIGAIYLFIALGLYGSSRFTLFLALAAPVASAFIARWGAQVLDPWLTLRLAADTAIVLASAAALWQFRAS